jgi:hypothetical protein
MRFELVLRNQPLRAAAEALVAEVFRCEYGAAIPQLPDLMIAVVDGAGQPQCVASLRDCSDGFFSEQYLDRPVEAAIAAASGQSVEREDILELCALAAARPGGLLSLMRGFASLGLRSGYRWGLFTATQRLRTMTARMGLSLVDLGPARPERIADAERWGSYYQQSPRVCAIDGWPAQARLDRMQLRERCAPAAELVS